MNLAVPGLLMVGLLAAAMLSLALCRWRRATAVAGTAAAGLLWLWLRSAPLDEQTSLLLVYGRSFTMTEGIRWLFLLLAAGAGLLFLLSLAWPQGRYFVPASLAVLSLLAAMLMVRPFSFGALFWLMAAALLAILVQSGPAGPTQGALRFLVMAVLTASLLLVAGWMLTAGQAAMQAAAGRLLALAFIILLAGFPFHIWVQPLMAAAPSLAAVFLFGLAQLAVTLFVTDLLAAYPWLQEMAALASLLRWSSGLAALTAGLLALTAADYGRLIGSLLLLDMSVSLALLLTPVAVGWETAVLLPLTRFISLLLIALGAGALQHQGRGVGFDAFRGWGRRRPLATAVFAFGIVSLSGLPLTVGFTGRWAALALIARQSSAGLNLPIILLLAMGGGIYGVWRGLSPLLVAAATVVEAGPTTRVARPRRVALILSLAGASALVVWPQMVLSYANQLVNLWLLADW